MKNTKFCFNCNEDVSTKIVEEEEIFKVKGTDISVKSKKRVCDKCDKALFDKELDNTTLLKAYEKYKKLNNMLTADEIKEIREKYYISQKGLALLLGWGEKTITRYENGSLQDKTHDDVMKNIKEYGKFIEYWNRNKGSLSEGERNKIEEKLHLTEPKIFMIKTSYKKYTIINGNVTGKYISDMDNCICESEHDMEYAYY